MKKFPRSITLVSDYRSRAVGLACLLWASSIVAVGAFWPFTATQENPFVGRAFITERQLDQYTGYRTGWDVAIMGDAFEFFLFDTPTTVTTGRGTFKVYDKSAGRAVGVWFPVAGIADEKQQTYTVDKANRTITFDSAEGYNYKVEGKVIVLHKLMDTKVLYEVDAPFFLADRSSSFWAGDLQGPPSFPKSMDIDVRDKSRMAQFERVLNHHRNYVDNLIAKAKGAPPVLLPTVDPDTPTPTPTPPPPVTASAQASATVVAPEPTQVADEADEDKKEEPRRPTGDELVDGKYDGVLVNEITAANDKIEIRIESKSEPSSGTPPTAPIKVSTALPELGRGDEELWGVATYGTPTTVSFGWKNQTGTAKFEGQLEGEKLSGTWSVEGANGEAGRGTFEATKSKL